MLRLVKVSENEVDSNSGQSRVTIRTGDMVIKDISVHGDGMEV